ncbi:ester cyclase [Natrinema sp. 1APR25-10V2]|uniref:ester cyclase n=1 Tax=Natrinema sp. 1APR25-10V2 TaxID=2951081 RepID=UPI00287635DC|nr:ester cyclase [Natrinema sp. 1APR25-10V2]MDS0476200.1 ester cyclase [Natrinema sp. 1APR25-10V2]
MSTTAETNKNLVRRYLNAFNDRDREALSELLAEDVVEHGIHEELQGVDEILEFLQAHFDVFPDYSGSTEAVVAEDDTVVVRYTVSGTHSGEYHDIEPTGHTVEWTGMAMYRIEDDRITEIWLEEDRLGLLERLEVVDPPAHLRI